MRPRHTGPIHFELMLRTPGGDAATISRPAASILRSIFAVNNLLSYEGFEHRDGATIARVKFVPPGGDDNTPGTLAIQRASRTIAAALTLDVTHRAIDIDNTTRHIPSTISL